MSDAHRTQGIFVSGTDTGIGKTRVAIALLRRLATDGVRAVGMKPVAAGVPSGAIVNEDVGALRAAGNVDAALYDMNPYSFAPAIAPHLAAAQSGLPIDLEIIASAYARLCEHASVIVVEGAGGVLVPLNAKLDMLDIPARLGLPVLLVVGIRLGCLNHALLSAQAILGRGLRFAGWVANRIDPSMDAADENVAALAERLPAPVVADIGWCCDEHSIRPGALRALGIG